MFVIEYVDAVKNIVFSTSQKDLLETLEKYKKKEPEPLCSQFKDRRSKDDAIKRHRERKEIDDHALFPSCKYNFY